MKNNQDKKEPSGVEEMLQTYKNKINIQNI